MPLERAACPRRFRCSLVLLVAFVALFCGAGREVIAREEAPAIAPFSTAHIVIAGTISAAGQELPVQGEGDIDAARGASHLTVGLPGTALETIVVDGRTYSRNVATGRWEYTEGTGANGVNAAQLAPYDPATIRAAGRNFSRVGGETVGGVAATHWRADVDLARLLGLTGGLGLLGSGGDSAMMDLWIGDADGRLRRLLVTAQGTANPAVGTAGATPAPSRLTMTVTFSNFDQPVSIIAPPGAVPATPRAALASTPVARITATAAFVDVAVSAAPVPNDPLAAATSGQGVLSARLILRFVAACSIIVVLAAVLLAVRQRWQLAARREE